jgi:galactokinase
MQEKVTISLDDNTKKRDHWSDYVAGVARVLELEGIPLTGANIYLDSDVPVGAGLSSSAALEISSALALLSTADVAMAPAKLAQIGQRAENQFVGMNCGIMDQFIAIHGKTDHAVFLDCRSLDYKLVPLPSDVAQIVICNTMVKHELAASQYNIRRQQCEEGVAVMRRDVASARALRDISLQQLNELAHHLPDLVLRRCRHVITEDERTLASIDALESKDLNAFGELMNGSHDSLRDDYEVSCTELDVLVDIARAQKGVLGARMTGGGFGGCTVNLVEVDSVNNFCTNVRQAYKQKTGIAPDIYTTTAAAGAHEYKA